MYTLVSKWTHTHQHLHGQCFWNFVNTRKETEVEGQQDEKTGAIFLSQRAYHERTLHRTFWHIRLTLNFPFVFLFNFGCEVSPLVEKHSARNTAKSYPHGLTRWWASFHIALGRTAVMTSLFDIIWECFFFRSFFQVHLGWRIPVPYLPCYYISAALTQTGRRQQQEIRILRKELIVKI